MASDDDSQSLDTHHDDKDWESQKENFRICYIDHGMTRKEAAEYMKEHFNFSATPRQWERKIKQWGFSKYTNREERLHQIAQTGKTVFDVSRPGRRPRSNVDEHGNLQPHVPHEDRNLRRFARRELSRSRSRSRSASFTDRPRPQFKQEFSDPSTNVDSPFDFNQLDSEMRRSSSNDGFHLPQTQTGGGSLQTFSPPIFHEHEPGAYGAAVNPSLPLSVGHNQWVQTQAGGPQQFNAAAAQAQYTVFPNDPTSSHVPQASGLPNGNQRFSVDASDPSFGFPITEPSMSSLSADYNQYVMAGADMGMAPGMLPENMMTEQSMYGNTIQLPLGSEPLSQTGFENNPGIKFAVEDVDSTPMLPTADTDPLQHSVGMDVLFPEIGAGNDGPLQNDVLPLVEEYTRAVQAAALGFVSRSSHNTGHAGELAADLIQPSRAFMASMAVILDNFAKSQQRSLQSMKDTCRNLRQKNTRLMQFLNSNDDMQPIPSIESHHNRSSLPPQGAIYGNMYTPNF